MNDSSLIYYLDIFGTIVFALSGVLVAARKDMDIIGALVLASTVAVGGGTLRDLMLRADQIFWMKNDLYIYVIILTVFVSSLWIKLVDRLDRRLLPIFDALGLAVFLGIGFNKALDYHSSYLIALILGTLTGVGGGVIRDTLADEIPFIFRKEIYASACILGAIAIIIGLQMNLPRDISIILGMVVTLMIRLFAIHKSLSLPKIKL